MLIIINLIFFTTCSIATKGKSRTSNASHVEKKLVTLKIRREKNLISARLVDIKILVNEVLVGTISNGEEKTFFFKPTKSGYSVIRIVSANAWVLEAADAIKDNNVSDAVDKKLRVKARAGGFISLYCDYKLNEIYVSKLEI